MGRGGFLTSLAATSFSRTLPHGVNEFKGRRTLKHITSTTNIVCRWRHASTESSTLVRCVSSIKSPEEHRRVECDVCDWADTYLACSAETIRRSFCGRWGQMYPTQQVKSRAPTRTGPIYSRPAQKSVRPSLAQLHKLRHCHRR